VLSLSRVRQKAEQRVLALMARGRPDRAREIVELFKTHESSNVDELNFYSGLLLKSGELERAKAVMELAVSKTDRASATSELESLYWQIQVPSEFWQIRGGAAAWYLLNSCEFKSVLDVGSGGGEQALQFAKRNKSVHCVDYGVSVYFQQSSARAELEAMSSVRWSIGNFNEMVPTETYDLVWCSHILEHQPDANRFIKHCLSYLSADGWLAITVPPLKHRIVGGHVSLWNAGLLLYQIVLAGNNCSEAIVMNYDYNISVLVRKSPIELPHLDFDTGDIDRLKAFFPVGYEENFDGRMYGFMFLR
jgi:2-polyprenyl-3-methyl-5-hydroxy-6-metoxy-1,4-benzoquinol methylase